MICASSASRGANGRRDFRAWARQRLRRNADMQLGLVVGTATSTLKHATLRGQKLLIVQPLMADGEAADGDPQIAVDAVGAGKGATVMITSDGKFVREIVKHENTPIRWSGIGIADA